jgi:hypothetical protein
MKKAVTVVSLLASGMTLALPAHAQFGDFLRRTTNQIINDRGNPNSSAGYEFNAAKRNIENPLKLIEERYANFQKKGVAGLDDSFSGAWWSRFDLETARGTLTGNEAGTKSLGRTFEPSARQNPEYATVKVRFDRCEKYTQEMEAARRIKFTGFDRKDLMFVETKTGRRLSNGEAQRL